MITKTLGAIRWLGLSLSLAASASGQQAKPLYKNDFQQAALDKVPEDLLVLDGAFAVKEEQGNKFLELPGTPLDTFGALFGPAEKDGIQATARVFGTSRGRRFPTFALGLNGVAGYRVQVSPGKKLLELYRGDSVKASVPYTWSSGHWTRLRLQVRKTSDGWTIEAKAWPEGKDEPASWMISTTDKEELPAGRASIFGSPFSDTPIQFDDLVVTRIGSAP
jgi:hypothetical protein